MQLTTIIESINLQTQAGKVNLSREITGAYVSDLLSDVLAHAKQDDLWVTLQTHPNVVAVASMKELAGIVLTNSRVPEDETLQKAEEESIPVFTTSMPTFEVAGKLYQLLE